MVPALQNPHIARAQYSDAHLPNKHVEDTTEAVAHNPSPISLDDINVSEINDDFIIDDDENDDLAVSGDGIGEEDPPDSNEDMDEVDEVDPELDCEDSGNTNGGRTKSLFCVTPLPEWLQAEFHRHVQDSSQRDKHGLPPLYHTSKTFWFPVQSTFFKLQYPSDSSHKPSPTSLYNCAFFLWDPACLLPEGIPCPACKTRLYKHDTVRRPRRCIDISCTFWIIGYRYRCPSCVNPRSKKHTVTFKSWDS